MSGSDHEITLLTCCLVETFFNRLHPVADSLDGHRVVPPGLELGGREVGLLHNPTRAVPVEGLQLIVLNLK